MLSVVEHEEQSFSADRPHDRAGDNLVAGRLLPEAGRDGDGARLGSASDASSTSPWKFGKILRVTSSEGMVLPTPPGPISVTTRRACRISIAMDRPPPVLFYSAPTRGRFFILSQGEGLFLCLRKSHAGC
jgi:hypothetical protein